MKSNISFFKIPEIELRQVAVLFVSFFAGAVLGLAVLRNSLIDFSSVFEFSSLEDSGFILQRVKFHLISLILGGSALGVFLLPIFAFLKGFTVSFTSLLLFCSYNLSDFLQFAIFELVVTVFLLVMICSSFCSSGIIFRSVFIKKDYFRREIVLSGTVFCFVLLLILIILISIFSFI